MFWKKPIVKVRIYKCIYGYCAEFYFSDADKILNVIEKCKRKIKKMLPIVDRVNIDMYVFGYPLYEINLMRGIVGRIDSEEIRASDLDTFVNILKLVLESKGMKYEVVVE